ncbi:hypothetical protein Syun_008074 [Stephania yunnanensis]|uniref:Chlororespiratory reduction 4 n=1 Tax=Stephania yunnanensis TaxID=152371 RepID=A0AAP0L128_9MAGN
MIVSTTSQTFTKPLQLTPSKNKNPNNRFESVPAISLLQLCKNANELAQIHSLLIKTSLIQTPIAFNLLLSSYASSGDPGALDRARNLFDRADFAPSSFLYNTLIKAYTNHGYPIRAFLFYTQMLCQSSVLPDRFTFTFVLAACSRLCDRFLGKQVHAQMVKRKDFYGVHSRNALMGFYVKVGEVGMAAKRVFDEIEEPDIVSWNCLLDGYVRGGEVGAARKVFDEMPERDVVSWTTMLVGYVDAGMLSEGWDLFGRMPERNVVSWSAMIRGCVSAGRSREALGVFKDMEVSGVEMDKVTMTSLLSACAGLGALDQGRWIHSYIDKHEIDVDAHLSAALIDMYCKCGWLDVGLTIFLESLDKKVFVWNAILGGLALHSRGKEAVGLFLEMLDSGTKPNEITFICVLSACSHSGLVDEGLEIFQSMEADHNVRPTLEHYGCMVDLLGRAGLLNDARRLVETMPMEVDGNVLRALLGACRIHGDIELGVQVGKALIELEPLNDANYVLLSNIYALANRWEDVGNLRRIMKARGARKRPGCSSIELNGAVHEFIAGDCSHPQSEEIYKLIDEMAEHLLWA